VTGEPSGEAGSASSQPGQSDSVQNSTSSSSPDLDQAKVIEETKQRFIRNQSTKLQKKPSVKEQTSPPPKKGSSKVLQSWGKASKEEAAALNFSSDKHKSDAVRKSFIPVNDVSCSHLCTVRFPGPMIPTHPMLSVPRRRLTLRPLLILILTLKRRMLPKRRAADSCRSSLPLQTRLVLLFYSSPAQVSPQFL